MSRTASGACESCERERAQLVVRVAGGQPFTVCARCAAVADLPARPVQVAARDRFRRLVPVPARAAAWAGAAVWAGVLLAGWQR